MDYLLSIGIPTYNGSNSLKKNITNLENILKEEGLSEKIQIIISDNCSTDDTYNVVNYFLNRYKNIIYLKNEKNLGYDKNVNNVIINSNSDYVWLLSDDDTISSGIKRIYDILLIEKPSYVFINFENEIEITPNSENLEYEKYIEINSFFNSEKFKNGLISSNIIKTEIWNKLPMELYFNSYWIHFAYLVKLFSLPNYQPLIIYYPKLIHQNLNEKNTRVYWGNNGKNIGIGLHLLHILNELKFTNANNKTKRRAREIITKSYPKQIFYARLSGFEVTKDILNDFKSVLPLSEYFIIKIYFYIPIKFIYKLWKIIKRH